jgi:hypothetical protein
VIDIMAALRASLTIATQVSESAENAADAVAQSPEAGAEPAEQVEPQLTLVPQAVPRKKNRRAA